MGLLLSQMELQAEILDNILRELDAIREILRNPIQTQARELFRRGCVRVQKGFLTKALNEFHGALKLDDTDFLVQFELGRLYLFGASPSETVVDLNRARQHLREAIRNGLADLRVSDAPQSAQVLVPPIAEAHLDLAIALFYLAGQHRFEGNSERSTQLLEEAAACARQATELDSGLAEAHYYTAKIAAVSDDAISSLIALHKCIALNRAYALRVTNEPDFDGIRDAVTEALEELRDQTLTQARADLYALLKVHESHDYLSYSECHTLDDGIKTATALLARNTYFDALDAQQIIHELTPRAILIRDRDRVERCTILQRAKAEEEARRKLEKYTAEEARRAFWTYLALMPVGGVTGAVVCCLIGGVIGALNYMTSYNPYSAPSWGLITGGKWGLWIGAFFGTCFGPVLYRKWKWHHL